LPSNTSNNSSAPILFGCSGNAIRGNFGPLKTPSLKAVTPEKTASFFQVNEHARLNHFDLSQDRALPLLGQRLSISGGDPTDLRHR
jgi:hypothetical protein